MDKLISHLPARWLAAFRTAQDVFDASSTVTKIVSCSTLALVVYRLARRRHRTKTLGRRVVVTGAASGIGLEVVRILAARGWRIWACDVNEKGLASLASFPNITPFVIDIRNAETCQALANAVGRDGGSLDGLVNIAGIVQQGPAASVTDEQVQKMFEVNAIGPMRLCRLLIPIMLRTPRGGSVINLTSVGGRVAWPWSGIYSPAKAALNLFTDSLRRESKANKLPLRITIVAPGAVQTPMAHAFLENMKSWVQKNKDDPFTPGCAREVSFLETMESRGLNMATVAISAPTVARKVVDVLEDPNPGAYYLVATYAFTALYYAALYLPTSIADEILLMM